MLVNKIIANETTKDMCVTVAEVTGRTRCASGRWTLVSHADGTDILIDPNGQVTRVDLEYGRNAPTIAVEIATAIINKLEGF